MNGTTPLHLELERELADWMGTEDALVFTTGYLANIGAIGTLLDPGDTVVCDTGDHASILDAVALSRAPRPALPPQPPRQARVDAVARPSPTAAACWSSSTASSRWRATCRPLPDVTALCREHGARLMVDEAHAVGVLGARGAGACELLDCEDDVDLRMGTFSKSLASCGGFIAGPARRDRLPARPVARLHVHRRRRPGRHRRGAGRAADHPLRRGRRDARQGARQRALPARRARRSSATG